MGGNTENRGEVLSSQAEIIKIGQKILAQGLVLGTWGNISARIEEELIAITPSGMDYGALQPEDIVVLDLEGNRVSIEYTPSAEANPSAEPKTSSQRKPSSEHPLHRAIYKARPDVKAIVHTHSIYGSACSVAGLAIPPITEDMVMLLGGGIEVAKYALPGTEELAENVVQALGTKNGVLLANHGIVGVGRSLEEALTACHMVEKSAQIFVMAKSLGNTNIINQENVDFLRDEYLYHYGQR